MKVKITTVNDDQGWLDSAGINYKVNEVVEMGDAEFERLNRYADAINHDVCGPAINLEIVEAKS